MIFGPLGAAGGAGGLRVARGKLAKGMTQIQVGFKPAVVIVSVCGAAMNGVLENAVAFVRPTDSDSYSFQYGIASPPRTGTVTFTDNGIQLTNLSIPSASFYYWFAIG